MIQALLIVCTLCISVSHCYRSKSFGSRRYRVAASATVDDRALYDIIGDQVYSYV